MLKGKLSSHNLNSIQLTKEEVTFLYQTTGQTNQENNVALNVKLSILAIVLAILKIRTLRKIHLGVVISQRTKHISFKKSH